MPDTDNWTIGRLLNWTADYFTQNGLDSPRLDAEVLLAEACGCKKCLLLCPKGLKLDCDLGKAGQYPRI